MKKTIFTICVVAIIALSQIINVNAQNPLRFKKEVARIDSLHNNHYSSGDSIVLFTGSSSIKIWTDIQEYFPNIKIINTGFGGSEMSDLLYYSDVLINKYFPYKIFIYEGDNDIASGKAPNKILKTTDSLIIKIHNTLPSTQVILISAKPSILRWGLKNEYEKLNNMYDDYCNKHSNVDYINIWDVMLDDNKELKKDIFLDDGLHMNSKGYKLWAEKFKNKFIWLNY